MIEKGFWDEPVQPSASHVKTKSQKGKLVTQSQAAS